MSDITNSDFWPSNKVKNNYYNDDSTTKEFERYLQKILEIIYVSQLATTEQKPRCIQLDPNIIFVFHSVCCLCYGVNCLERHGNLMPNVERYAEIFCDDDDSSTSKFI